MARLSNYLENALINATLRGIQYTSPAKVYIALYTSDPTDADIGTEVSGGGYARQEVVFGEPVDGQTSNSQAVLFPVATAPWGTVTHFGIRDALTGGNLLFYAPLAVARTIDVDNQLVFNIGQIVVTAS